MAPPKTKAPLFRKSGALEWRCNLSLRKGYFITNYLASEAAPVAAAAAVSAAALAASAAGAAASEAAGAAASEAAGAASEAAGAAGAASGAGAGAAAGAGAGAGSSFLPQAARAAAAIRAARTTEFFISNFLVGQTKILKSHGDRRVEALVRIGAMHLTVAPFCGAAVNYIGI